MSAPVDLLRFVPILSLFGRETAGFRWPANRQRRSLLRAAALIPNPGTVPLDSSAIASATYTEATRSLVLDMTNGTVIDYYDVPPQTFDALDLGLVHPAATTTATSAAASASHSAKSRGPNSGSVADAMRTS